MNCTSFRMRTVNSGANHEIVLPNGKRVLIDPFYMDCTAKDFSRDDVSGADYIILTHAHLDHDSDLGYLANKFQSKVFVGAMSAEAVLKFHKIPYDNLIPVFPGQTYTMDGVTFKFWQAKHNPFGPKRTYDPEKDISKTKYGVEGHKACDDWGSMESLDVLITTENNFRILVASGSVLWKDLFFQCREERPNVVLRQAGVRKNGEQVSPEELADLMIQYGAQVIFPFHMDVLVKKWGAEKTEDYMAQVAASVRGKMPGTEFIYPKAYAWYEIGIGVNEL